MLSKKMLSQEKEKEKENGKEKAVILPYTIQYQCNFIDIKGNIVRDRSYCETNKFNALLSSQEKEVAKEVEKGRRISALGTWDYSNPNILSIQLSNGMVRNICRYCYCYCNSCYYCYCCHCYCCHCCHCCYCYCYCYCCCYCYSLSCVHTFLIYFLSLYLKCTFRFFRFISYLVSLFFCNLIF